MSFFGLGSYGSDDEKPSYSSDDDSDDDDSDGDGDDGENPLGGGPLSSSAPAATKKLVLPTPHDAFGQVKGPPKFLMPEATRPIARNASHAPPPVAKREVAYVDEPEVRRRAMMFREKPAVRDPWSWRKRRWFFWFFIVHHDDLTDLYTSCPPSLLHILIEGKSVPRVSRRRGAC